MWAWRRLVANDNQIQSNAKSTDRSWLTRSPLQFSWDVLVNETLIVWFQRLDGCYLGGLGVQIVLAEMHKFSQEL